MREPLSGEVVVREGTTVSLACKANGNPVPTVSWVKFPSHRSSERKRGHHKKKKFG